MTTYVASSKSSNESVASENVLSDTRDKSFEKKRSDSNVCPFNLRCSFGINPKIPLVNLTTDNRKIIAYCCSHVVMLHDYRTGEMFPLQGHQNEVKTISTTFDGKFLLTADFGEDSVVVVWDTKIRVPICTLFNAHGHEGTCAARISANGKYIVTVGNEKCQRVHLWLWTFGGETPDASLELTDNNSERVKEISFNEETPEEFLLTADFSVIFLAWRQDKLECCRPKMSGKRFGIFNTSCYDSRAKCAFTSTTNGYVLMWNSVNDEKRLYKYIQLQKCDITTIVNHEGTIITGNSEGQITFYDSELKLLYWCEDCNLDSIKSISFGRSISEETESEQSEETLGEKSTVENKSENSEENDAESWSSKLSLHIECSFTNYLKNDAENKPFHLATDATLQNAPFSVPNFIVSTSKGLIALVNISKLKCRFILRYESCNIVCLDTHPENDYLVTGDMKGHLSLYDFRKRKLMVSRPIPQLPDFKSIIQKQEADNRIIYVTCLSDHESLKSITALKYSPKSMEIIQND